MTELIALSISSLETFDPLETLVLAFLVSRQLGETSVAVVPERTSEEPKDVSVCEVVRKPVEWFRFLDDEAATSAAAVESRVGDNDDIRVRRSR